MKLKENTVIIDALQIPEVVEVFNKYGLGCSFCPIASVETFKEGTEAHGLAPDIIMDEIEDLIKKRQN